MSGIEDYDTKLVDIYKRKNQVNIKSRSHNLKALSKLYGACKLHIQVSPIVVSYHRRV